MQDDDSSSFCVDFVPSNVLSVCNEVWYEQARTVKFLYQASLTHDDLVLHVDMRDLTWSSMQSILSSVQEEDVENGVDVWRSVAMRTKRIDVTPPLRMSGGSFLIRTLLRFLPSKVRSRVRILDGC